MRWLIVLVMFVLVPLAELWVLLTVGDALGVVPTILILLADSIIGGVLLRTQGRGAWRRFVAALRAGRPPSRELADGLLIVIGGALLLTPGFLTDVVGILLLVPPSRALVRRALERTIARRLAAGLAGAEASRASARSGRPAASRARRDYDVEGTATEPDGAPTPHARPRLER